MYGGLRLRFGLGSGLFWEERAKRAVPVMEVSPSSAAKIYSLHFLRDALAMDPSKEHMFVSKFSVENAKLETLIN